MIGQQVAVPVAGLERIGGRPAPQWRAGVASCRTDIRQRDRMTVAIRERHIAARPSQSSGVFRICAIGLPPRAGAMGIVEISPWAQVSPRR